MSEKQLVSVIIPTYNSDRTIGLCLESIARQTYKNIEIILIDRNSSDNTVLIARKYTSQIYTLEAERASSKNYGIQKSHGKYICFVDSDMILSPTVIEDCVKALQLSSKSIGVIIPEKSIGNTFWSKVRAFERIFYQGTIIESPRFFKKDFIEQIGGFDNDIIFFEESTLPYKLEALGYHVRLRINSYILHYEFLFSLSDWLKKKYYYGKTLRIYKKLYPKYAKKQFGISYRLHLFFLNKNFYLNPLISLSILLLKFFEFLFLFLGYLSNF